MTGIRLSANNLAGAAHLEPLGSTSIGFHFWHGTYSYLVKYEVSSFRRLNFFCYLTSLKLTTSFNLKLQLILYKSRFRCNIHCHLPSFHGGRLDNNSHVFKGFTDLIEEILTQAVCIDNLPAPESQSHFHLVFLL